MKKQLLLALSLAAIIPFANGCDDTPLPEDRIITNTDVDPIVRNDENGQIVKVNDPDDPANSKLSQLSVKNKTISLFYDSSKKEFESKKIDLEYLPYNANISGLEYESSDTTVATVSTDGVITAVKEGVADITVKANGGELVSSCHVVVNNSNVPVTYATNRRNEIKNAQNDTSFSFGDSIYVASYESTARYEGEGNDKKLTESRYIQKIWASKKITSSNDDTESMWFSESEAYFRITSEATETLVEGGSVIPSRVDYIFYTTDDYFTYVFKTDGNKRNYMRVDQSSLAGQNVSKFDALSLVIGNFFVAGAEIITRQFDLSTGADLFGDSTFWSTINKCGRFSGTKDKTELSVESIASHRYMVGDDQEDSFNIPARTIFTVDETIRCLWENNLVSSRVSDSVWSWKVNGIDYRDVSHSESYFDMNVELYKPNTSLYTKVDTIFDL